MVFLNMHIRHCDGGTHLLVESNYLGLWIRNLGQTWGIWGKPGLDIFEFLKRVSYYVACFTDSQTKNFREQTIWWVLEEKEKAVWESPLLFVNDKPNPLPRDLTSEFGAFHWGVSALRVSSFTVLNRCIFKPWHAKKNIVHVSHMSSHVCRGQKEDTNRESYPPRPHSVDSRSQRKSGR